MVRIFPVTIKKRPIQKREEMLDARPTWALEYKHCAIQNGRLPGRGDSKYYHCLFPPTKDEEENCESVIDLPNIVAVVLARERQHIPKTTGYAENTVPQYSSVFKANFRND